MRFALLGMAVLSLSLALLTSADAGGAKDVELKGSICCAKCELGVSKTCATVIVTKENGKDVTYYFDAKSHKKYHGDTCTEAKAGSVSGTVATVGDKKTITVKTLKYN